MMGAKGWFTFVLVYSILSAVHAFNEGDKKLTVIRFLTLAVIGAFGYISC